MATKADLQEQLDLLAEKIPNGEAGDIVRVALALRDVQRQVENLDHPSFFRPALLVPALATILIGALTIAFQQLHAESEQNLKMIEMRHANSNKLVELYGKTGEINEKIALVDMMTNANWIVADVKTWAQKEKERLSFSVSEQTKDKVARNKTLELQAAEAETLALNPEEDPTTDAVSITLGAEEVKLVDANAVAAAQVAVDAVAAGEPILLDLNAPPPRTLARSLWYEGYAAYRKRDYVAAKLKGASGFRVGTGAC